MFNVNLVRNGTVDNNHKMRGSFSGANVFSATLVNNGNFSNLNVLVDNELEVSCAYATAVSANFIIITFSGITVVGQITDWIYVNDNNTRIAYVVDSYSSARTSGMISDMTGLCERTFLNSALLTNNMQAEPSSASDYSRRDQQTVTFNALLNTFVQSFEGINVPMSGLLDNGICFILTVSQKIRNYLNLNPFDAPPVGFTQELQTVPELAFNATDSVAHAGGFYRGLPLRFNQLFEVADFVTQILGGCGFRTELPANGYDTQTQDTSRQYLLNYNRGGGQVYTMEKNLDADPIESTVFITTDDIFNLYAIPANFASNQDNIFWTYTEIPYDRNVSNLHEWQAETTLSAKLLSYPWQYLKCVTSNGDTIDIIPQSHHNPTQAFAGTNIPITLRYVGGDMPRLMGTFSMETFAGAGGNIFTSMSNWFTIRSYPMITLSITDSYGIQLQKDIANTRKLSALYTNSRISAQLESPIKQGYLDRVNGTSETNSAQSIMDKIGSFFGGIIGSVENWLNGGVKGGNVFEDTAELNYYNERRMIAAGNFISSQSNAIMGNDFITQLSTSAFSVFLQGASNTELFTASRYFETFGVSCNCILSPLTNAGTLLGIGTNSSINAINGRTFYKFSEIDVMGIMPLEWKLKIKELFESGVYLYD